MIRSAAIEDAPAIRDLIRSVPGVWQSTWRADAIERSIQSADGLAFIDTIDGRITGFVCAHDLGLRAYVSELVVSPFFQNRRIGSALLRHVEEAMVKRGCHVLIADVWHDAEKFYRARDWSPPDAVLLRKRLDSRA